MNITISIVSYNTKEAIKRCITSIYRYTKDLSFEVIVIDNGSQDGTQEMLTELSYKNLTLILNKTNTFYSHAHNQALNKAHGRYFLILNSDVFFVDNSIKKLVQFMESHKKVGAAEGVEIYENGQILHTGSKKSSTLIDFYELSFIGKRLADLAGQEKIRAFRYDGIDRRKTFEVDVACDAFLMLRTATFKQLKGYDESLKLYYTENDLCLRIQNKGYAIFHVGNARIMHTVSLSANKLKWNKLKLYYADLLQYYRKHDSLISGLLLYLLLNAEMVMLKIFRPKMFD